MLSLIFMLITILLFLTGIGEVAVVLIVIGFVIALVLGQGGEYIAFFAILLDYIMALV